MALLSELVATCEAFKVDTRGTLQVFARRLREAGRISTAGRGRGAAHMTYLDAARFLIACAATDQPEQAVDAEFVFSTLVRQGALSVDADFPMSEEQTLTLDTALAFLLESIGTGVLDEVVALKTADNNPLIDPLHFSHFCLIVRRNGGGASLRIHNGRYHYSHPSLAAVVTNRGGPAAEVAMEAFERETRRFRTGKNLTAELEGRLLRNVANLIAGKTVSVRDA